MRQAISDGLKKPESFPSTLAGLFGLLRRGEVQQPQWLVDATMTALDADGLYNFDIYSSGEVAVRAWSATWHSAG